MITLTAALRPAPRRGRPPCCPPEVVALVAALRRRGLSLAAIGAELNTQGIPTPTGRPQWTKSHVDRLLHTRHAQDLLDGWSQPPRTRMSSSSRDGLAPVSAPAGGLTKSTFCEAARR